VPSHHWSQTLIYQLGSLQTFQVLTLSLASTVVSLGKLTVYAASAEGILVYSTAAIAISQTAAALLLFGFGKLVLRISRLSLRLASVVTIVLLANVVATILFEYIFFVWNIETIQQSPFQRFISFSFAVFTYLGFGWLIHVLTRNFSEVDLAKGLISSLSKQQYETSQTILEARTFASREISLEIQSTRGTIENLISTSDLEQSVNREIAELQRALDEVELRVNRISSRLPGSYKFQKSFPSSKISLSGVIDSSTRGTSFLPGLIALVAFFGFCNWLGYFMNEFNAAMWGLVLSSISFGIFLSYEKLIVPNLLQKSGVIRLAVFEIVILVYLFFWLVILGFFAGDNSIAYGAALVYAVIPFVFFNIGIFISGVILSSQEQRERLTVQATVLRSDLFELEKIRSNEDEVWKSLFAGDIASSPTTASVILRDASISSDHNRIADVIPNVNKLWSSVLQKLPASR
jgi:hypothetical protein